MGFKVLFVSVLVLGFGVYFISNYFGIRPVVREAGLEFLTLPPGFNIEVFAEDLSPSFFSTPGPQGGPRLMEFKNDTVFVAVPNQGSVITFEDKNKDGKPEAMKTFIDGLNNPHNVAFSGDWVYIATEDRVLRVKDANGDNVAERETLEKLVNLPTGNHWTRTVKIFGNSMYVSVGSTCNVCNEHDDRRATIMKCSLDGKNCATFAKGLRNTVDFVEYKGKIYGTDNGRDRLGNDIPPDEINIIEEGKNYGWPICYGKNIHDTDFDPAPASPASLSEAGEQVRYGAGQNTLVRIPCLEPFETPSFIDLPAHVAPLGLAFYAGTKFPEEYQGKLFVAYHGSWNADPPVGYKVVTVDVETGEINDFATGWLRDTSVRGRPVGIINFRDGLLVSDDNAGKIYRIFYDK
ncbi:MAG: PQQ-dependent sugar dehydrogenase [Candidatus Liptonbacteria bacterium]|nr:PQQ-dependent sugar dehydrogenase [Candidatus Liptonbacteria bacterium]